MKLNKYGRRLKVVCDIDGVLCENTRVPYESKKPNYKQIAELCSLHASGCKIILFTSRKNRYKKQTVEWLEANVVPYHELLMNKPKADFYVDDKSVKKVTSIK